MINLSTTGNDGVLVYTYDNTLDHYIVDSNDKVIQLIKVGQITLTGVIRAPPRVRAVSWIVPDLQLRRSSTPSNPTDQLMYLRTRRGFTGRHICLGTVPDRRQARLAAALFKRQRRIKVRYACNSFEHRVLHTSSR